MRIALWNGSGLDNLGDRLLDHMNRRELGRRLPNASFHTFTPWPSPRVPLVKIDRDGRWDGERQFDAIVIGGGALLIGPPFVHPSLQTCYLGPYPDRFRDPCPVIWNAVCSDGQFVPALAEPWRAYVRAASRRLTYRSVRNTRTAELLENCGVSDPIAIVPDPVTLLCPPRRHARHAAGRRRIGLALGASGHSDSFVAHLESPADGSDWNPDVQVRMPTGMLSADAAPPPSRKQAFVARVATATAHLRDRCDLEVCAFGAVYGDHLTAGALAVALNCPSITLCDPVGTDALEWIASLDCLIASRLHACILALVAGTPLVALDPYFSPVVGTSKVREFMAAAGLLDGYISLESFLASDDAFDELVERVIAGSDRLPAVHAALSAAAHAHFDRISEMIGERRSM